MSQPTSNKTVLSGHTSAETAYVVEDYPYGFRLRCKMRYWIETKAKQGQRVVTQTTNPKVAGEVWNKPKASTYSNLRVLYRNNDNGHIENAALSFYAPLEEIVQFEHVYAPAVESERDQKELKLLKTIAAHQVKREEARQAALEAAK